jgi:hypothetical protein
MKYFVLLCVVFSMISLSAFSQKNPPGDVIKAFTEKYATAQSIKWDSEEKNEWEADFTLDGKKMSAAFDNSGKWMESETSISEKDLPASVSATLDKEFKDYKKSEIVIFDSPAAKGFEIGLKKGETSIEVIIDRNGKVIKNTGKKVIEKAEKGKK